MVEPQQLVLPNTKELSCNELADAIIFVYGDYKCGKTSLLAAFPNAVLLMTEPGGKWLKAFKVYPKNWSELKKYSSLIRGKEGDKYQNVGIDTLDIAYEMCRKYVCAEMAIEHPSDLKWGKAWSAIREEFSSFVNTLARCGKGLFFTSHAKAEMEDDEDKKKDKKPPRIIPSASSQAVDIVGSIADMIAYVQVNSTGRHLVIRGDETVQAGHRVQDRLVGVKAIPMGKTADEAYRNFVDVFNGKDVKGVICG